MLAYTVDAADEIIERVVDPNCDLLDAAIREDECKRLQRMLLELPLFEADVLQRRFGLDGAAEETLEAIGNRWHRCPSAVHYAERRALERLRELWVP